MLQGSQKGSPKKTGEPTKRPRNVGELEKGEEHYQGEKRREFLIKKKRRRGNEEKKREVDEMVEKDEVCDAGT